MGIPNRCLRFLRSCDHKKNSQVHALSISPSPTHNLHNLCLSFMKPENLVLLLICNCLQCNGRLCSWLTWFRYNKDRKCQHCDPYVAGTSAGAGNSPFPDMASNHPGGVYIKEPPLEDMDHQDKIRKSGISDVVSIIC